MSETSHCVRICITLDDAHSVWSILSGHNCILNDNLCFKPGWYAIAASPQSHTGVQIDHDLRFKFKDYPGFQTFQNWKACMVGMVCVSHSLPHSAAKDSYFACASKKVKNIVSNVMSFNIPIRFESWVGMSYISKTALSNLQVVLGSACHSVENRHSVGFLRDAVWESNCKLLFAEPIVVKKKPNPIAKKKPNAKKTPIVARKKPNPKKTPTPIVKTTPLVLKKPPKPSNPIVKKQPVAKKPPIVTALLTSPTMDIRRFFN